MAKINIRLILELLEAGLSQRSIAKSRKISRNSIQQVYKIAQAKQITLESIRDISDSDLYEKFFPGKYQAEKVYTLPDYESVNFELKHKGVTLNLLWNEYKSRVLEQEGVPVQYTKFCKDFHKYVAKNNVVSHLEKKPGSRCEVDWSGQGMHYIDAMTGDKVKVHLFVGILPYSNYSYAEPTLDMKQNTWLQCHINMYNFFKGVPSITVCDNLKTGVISHPREGDIVLNHDYEAMALHYGTVIMPTGVRKPRHKANVEGLVRSLATALIGKFRNTAFKSFAELKETVTKEMRAFNETGFQKKPGSRSSHFEEELPFLQPLPEIPYEVCEWKHRVKVGKNSHITYLKNYYSCPFQYCGEEVSLRITQTTVRIYQNNKLLSSHLRFPPNLVQRYSTHKEDMPDEFNQPLYNDTRMLDWAKRIGPKTLGVIEQIFNSVPIKEQGYRPALSILNLTRRFKNKEIEVACSVALERYTSPRHRHIQAILISMKEASKNRDLFSESSKEMGYARGSDYYKGISNE